MLHTHTNSQFLKIQMSISYNGAHWKPAACGAGWVSRPLLQARACHVSMRFPEAAGPFPSQITRGTQGGRRTWCPWIDDVKFLVSTLSILDASTLLSFWPCPLILYFSSASFPGGDDWRIMHGAQVRGGEGMDAWTGEQEKNRYFPAVAWKLNLILSEASSVPPACFSWENNLHGTFSSR